VTVNVPKERNKGSYALFLTFNESFKADVGALGTLTVEKGEYCYAGSAMNGLSQRIRRHFSKKKKMHWHIDRLTVKSDAMEAFVSYEKDECGIARIAEECSFVPVFKGFGASDCKCETHLFYNAGGVKEKMLNAAAMIPFAP